MEAWQRADVLDLSIDETIEPINAYAVDAEFDAGRARVENEHDVLARIFLAGQLKPVLLLRERQCHAWATNSSYICDSFGIACIMKDQIVVQFSIGLPTSTANERCT